MIGLTLRITPQRIKAGMILLAVILMDILSGMEFDLFVPSFPELQTYFRLSPFWVEALLSVNFAGYCLGLFFVGTLADRYGRKPMVLMGLMIFIVGSVLCLKAPSYPYLLTGRFFQGVGVASPAILSFLIISDAYALKQQQTLLAMLNGVMNLSVGAAPVVGSYVTFYFQWQGNFWVLLILSLFTFFITFLCLPKAEKSPPSQPVSALPFSSDTYTPNDCSPVGYGDIFKSKPLRVLLWHMIPQIVPYWIFVGMTPLLYMEALGVSLRDFGYYQGSLAFVFGLGSLVSGFFIERYHTKKLLFLSSGICIVGVLTVLSVTVMDSPHPLLITCAFFPFAIGQVIPVAILFPLTLNFMPHLKGRVSSFIYIGRLVVSGLGLQLAGYWYQGNFRATGVMMVGFMVISILTLLRVIKHLSPQGCLSQE